MSSSPFQYAPFPLTHMKYKMLNLGAIFWKLLYASVKQVFYVCRICIDNIYLCMLYKCIWISQSAKHIRLGIAGHTPHQSRREYDADYMDS